MTAARLIFEIRQRSWDHSVSRELGFFVDENLADMAIDALYREAWSVVMATNYIESEPWFPAESRETIKQGLDYWRVDDLNSPTPIFYKIPHKLFNSVPSSVSNFTFSIDGVDFF